MSGVENDSTGEERYVLSCCVMQEEESEKQIEKCDQRICYISRYLAFLNLIRFRDFYFDSTVCSPWFQAM